MNLFFEESGDFKVGAVLSQAGEAYQVEMPSGKRTKVKVKDVLLQYEKPAPAELLEQAKAIAADIDFEFLWEVAGQEEFGFAELGAEYFGHAPLPAEAAGLVLALHGAPIYFYKKGRGRYKAAPEQSLRAAQAGIEKKKQQAVIQAGYVEELKAGRLPAAMQPMVQQLLFKPDKNTIEYKALEAACDELHTHAAAADAGHRRHQLRRKSCTWRASCSRTSRAAPASRACRCRPRRAACRLADVAAFSIDDVTTTEIDDAFSVTMLADGMVQGRHPHRRAGPGHPSGRRGRQDGARAHVHRLYAGRQNHHAAGRSGRRLHPGRGQDLPGAVAVRHARPGRLDACCRPRRAPRWCRSRATCATTTSTTWSTKRRWPAARASIRTRPRWRCCGSGRCSSKRGAWKSAKSSASSRSRTTGSTSISTSTTTSSRWCARKRGAPLDKIVAELMIFANSTWGKLLHDSGVPGIYRSQGTGGGAGWAAKLQVRMVTHAAPHQGLGVDQYAWSTSPLRRYTDLVNQWQILACAEHGVTAPLVAPFKPRDANLFAIVSAFDAAYAAYNDHQQNMERYWCLRWLGQEEARQVEAVVLKDEVLRLVDIPLIIRLPGMPQVARGAQVKLDILRWDEVDLSIEARLLEVPAAAEIPADAELDYGEDEDSGQAARRRSEAVEAEGAGRRSITPEPADD